MLIKASEKLKDLEESEKPTVSVKKPNALFIQKSL